MPNTSKHNTKPEIIVGKYILESISIGMYDHPLMAIREYIQNSTDSIDEFCKYQKKSNALALPIHVTVDGRNKSVSIKDGGKGIPASKARSVLCDLGKSEKDPELNRGFRGIGRLGGLGYCEQLVFRTTTEGEAEETTVSMDCTKMRELVNSTNLCDAAFVVDCITSVTTSQVEKTEHYFVVEMNRVRSSRNVLLDVPAIKAYLSQVAPLPFNPENFFEQGEKIEAELQMRNIPLYRTYSVFVNDEQLFKPYAGQIRQNKERTESLNTEDILFIDLSDDLKLLAFGWIGKSSLSGSISPSTLVDGIRLRSGNIMIGRNDLLSEFFREKRFNGYLLGEIYLVDRRLVPNARRDDLEDNAVRDKFLEAFVREIGIPYSRAIREDSVERSKKKKESDYVVLQNRALKIIRNGYLTVSQKAQMQKELQQFCSNGHEERACKEAKKLLSKLDTTTHILDQQSNEVHPAIYELNDIFELVYKESGNKSDAERIIEKIIGDTTS